MDEIYEQEQDQNNESGMDMHDCYHHHHPLERLSWHEKNRILLDGFNKIRPLIYPESKPIAQRNCANPF